MWRALSNWGKPCIKMKAFTMEASSSLPQSQRTANHLIAKSTSLREQPFDFYGGGGGGAEDYPAPSLILLYHTHPSSWIMGHFLRKSRIRIILEKWGIFVLTSVNLEKKGLILMSNVLLWKRGRRLLRKQTFF